MITYTMDNSLPTKESEPVGIASAETSLITEVGQELPLPPEVIKAGVTIHPTSVVLPKSVQQMGVKVVGNTIPKQTKTVTIPLTDDQIAKGLKQSITSSIRWLATWCVRRLKQLI